MLKIHGASISVHTRKVIITALEEHLTYGNEPVIPFCRRTDWVEFFSSGKIPVAEVNRLVLRDSVLNCAYLVRKQP